MVFSEICKQVSKETGYPKQMVSDIFVAIIRVSLEELITNKEHAVISLKGLIDASLHRKHYKLYLCVKDERTELDRWVLRFKVSKKVKALFNDEMDIKDFTIGSGIPLYPETYYKTHEVKKKKKKPTDKAMELVPVEYKYSDVNRKKRMRLRKKLKIEQAKNNLPEED